MFAYFRFRFQRQRRRLRREFRVLASWSRNYINRHIWGKWRQLGIIRRLVVVWWGLAIALVLALLWQSGQLSKPYHHISQAKGAVMAEGSVGQIKVINPVLPDTQASADVSRLIFNGLVRYNTKGALEPDLATSWDISADGKTYTFHLRRGVKWHDGVPFTSEDVAFTLAAIQNPDSRSPVAPSWQGITADPIDELTLVYHLPNAYPPFLAACTQGIIPRHLLESIEPSALRANDFNQKPVGTGPYKISSFESAGHRVMLTANNDYYGGRPKIHQFEYRWYDSTSKLHEAYAKRQILAFGDVEPSQISQIAGLPNLKLHTYSQPNQSILIMRNSQTILRDKNVRAAINLATDRNQIINDALVGQADISAGPLLPGQVGFAGKLQLPKTNLEAAQKLLDQAGWVKGNDGFRAKDGQVLELTLVTRDGGVWPQVAGDIKTQLARAGIAIKVRTADLETLEQTYIRPRNYDLLLFGYQIGPDPDVYAFWESSQGSDPGLNLAVYNAPIADKALEAGRINPNPQVRKGKYLTFQQQWLADVPSVPLYSTDYIYAASSRVVGISGTKLMDPTDRFYNIQNWTIAEAPVR
ncbi:MAG TPA: ABC transporter substrate-binding protein [Candidatus Saccharimonadales bacterium]|nr:ABC transporter substrate-binding protein [Candidatus Saccharimonadales bacterium]